MSNIKVVAKKIVIILDLSVQLYLPILLPLVVCNGLKLGIYMPKPGD